MTRMRPHAALARLSCLLILWAFLASLDSGIAAAHFRLGTTLRIVHIERLEGGVRLYIRMPTPLAYTEALTDAGQGGAAPTNIPFVLSGEEDGAPVHRIDAAALSREPLRFGRLVADGYRFVLDGEALEPTVEAVAVYPREDQPPFAELAQAKGALSGPPYPPGAPPAFVGDTVTDLQLYLPSDAPNGEIRLSANVPPDYAPQGFIANIMLDHLASGTRITRASGLLRDPVVINASALTAALTFTRQGVRHILEGWDHVLFVLCLVLSATTAGALIWRVSGFTLGHMVTLIAGFFGFAPANAWLVPTIEVAIALSIIYAAAIALLRRPGGPVLPVTVGIGLLHGFGFAFVLTSMLQLEAPRLWVSLLSFNLGIELGQLAIVLAIWPALWLLGRHSARARRWAVVTISVGAIGIALYWTVERLVVLATVLAA